MGPCWGIFLLLLQLNAVLSKWYIIEVDDADSGEDNIATVESGYERRYGVGVLNPDGNITTLKEVENVTLEACEEECSKVPDCLAYTYISTALHCDLKDALDMGGGFTEREDLVSGRKLIGDLYDRF